MPCLCLFFLPCVLNNHTKVLSKKDVKKLCYAGKEALKVLLSPEADAVSTGVIFSNFIRHTEHLFYHFIITQRISLHGEENKDGLVACIVPKDKKIFISCFFFF